MKRWIPLCALLALLAAACGGDAGGPTTTAVGTTTAADASTTAGSTMAASTTTTPTAAGTTTMVAPQPPREVAFPTADGLTLEGRLYPAGPTWVVLAHMFPADMGSWFEFAAAAQAQGYSALAYNNRGYGNSDPGEPLDVGADALAAIAFARAAGAGSVLFFGASMNGAAALFAAAEEDLAGIASLSGVPEWDNTPGLEGAARITEPALFVAAEDDGGADETARMMAEAVGGPAQVEIYPTGGHGTRMFSANPGLTELLLGFIRQHS
jgi:pimeloyl-ACP methyl ester carboxylesterase